MTFVARIVEFVFAPAAGVGSGSGAIGGSEVVEVAVVFEGEGEDFAPLSPDERIPSPLCAATGAAFWLGFLAVVVAADFADEADVDVVTTVGAGGLGAGFAGGFVEAAAIGFLAAASLVGSA